MTADLSSIGGSPAQSFAGSGNTFTFFATVAPATPVGNKLLPVTITDDQARVANATIALVVQQPHIVISQIYGGGGNASATYTNDFVELYNPDILPIALGGLYFTDNPIGEPTQHPVAPLSFTEAQGFRVFNLLNPYEPKEVGYYVSPPYPGVNAGYNARQIRESYQDPTTGLIYMTDGNGGGLTVLRWTGPVPPNYQIPGAR